MTRVADQGLRYNRFHVVADLLADQGRPANGRNHHRRLRVDPRAPRPVPRVLRERAKDGSVRTGASGQRLLDRRLRQMPPHPDHVQGGQPGRSTAGQRVGLRITSGASSAVIGRPASGSTRRSSQDEHGRSSVTSTVRQGRAACDTDTDGSLHRPGGPPGCPTGCARRKLEAIGWPTTSTGRVPRAAPGVPKDWIAKYQRPVRPRVGRAARAAVCHAAEGARRRSRPRHGADRAFGRDRARWESSLRRRPQEALRAARWRSMPRRFQENCRFEPDRAAFSTRLAETGDLRQHARHLHLRATTAPSLEGTLAGTRSTS